jgi:predicted RNase H-like nuclease (RuvC/YqgF family)
LFKGFIDIMLEEEKGKEKQVLTILTADAGTMSRGHEESYINSLESEIECTASNIDKLHKVLSGYELEIKKMQLNLSSVSEMTQQLCSLKESYLTVAEKCSRIDSLRVEVADKERRLREMREAGKVGEF